MSGLLDWLTGNDKDTGTTKDDSNVMFDRGVSSATPAGASGSYDLNTGQGHSSQGYADGTTFSWNTDGQGNHSQQHWTDRSVPVSDPGRHTAPDHAK